MSFNSKCRCIYLVFIAALLFNCSYQYPLTAKNTSPSTNSKTETLHNYFWGLSQPYLEAQNCEGNGLHQVIVKTNYFYSFATVASLGIWAPIQIEWKCDKDSPTDDIGANLKKSDLELITKDDKE